MIRTIIVDDHKLFSEGIEKVLTATREFTILSKFNDGRSLLGNFDKLAFDLLLIDIDMPELSGLDVVKRIRITNKDVKIVVLTMHGVSAFLNEARLLGANGYLTKSIDSDQLVKSLFLVCSGTNIFPESKPIQPNSDSILSDREEEILRLLIKGYTSKEISQKINISPLTVKVHRRNMIRKLKVKNSAELVSKAIQMGFLS